MTRRAPRQRGVSGMKLREMTREELPAWYDQELSEAFPPNERKPLEDFFALIDAGRYQLLGLYEDGTLLGYAGMWSDPAYPAYVLLDQLGVTAARRNGGLGGKILALLGERYRGIARIITEAERPVPGGDPAENALRLRRLGFYQRAGFVNTYEMGSCGVRFQTLILGDPPEDLSGLMEAHRAIYGPARTDVKVPLGPDEEPELPYWMREHGQRS